MDEGVSERAIIHRLIVCHLEGNIELAPIYELSIDGCKIETPAKIQQGDSIAIAIPNNIKRGDKVIWFKARHAGILFNERTRSVKVSFLRLCPWETTSAAKPPAGRFSCRQTHLQDLHRSPLIDDEQTRLQSQCFFVPRSTREVL